MYIPLNCIVVDADPANRQEMGEFLLARGLALLGSLASADQLPQHLTRPEAPQLVIVNLDPNPQEALRKLAPLVRQFHSTSFFALSRVIDANLLMEAMHLGIAEFIPLPVSEEKFQAGIERVARLHGMNKRAKIIQVLPTIGGCGSTTIACNVAAHLARTGRKTALLDLDLIRGTVASSFDLHPRYTIADVMDSAEKLDKQLLDNALAMHAGSGLAVLGRPELPEETQRISQAGLLRLLNVLGQIFDYVVMDSLMSVDPLYSAAVRAADVNLLVMQLNIPSVKNAERFIGAMRRMGVETARIRIVVNRFVKKGWDIEPQEVERALGMKIDWAIPNDFKNAIAAINYGEPVVLRAPRAEMSTSLAGLVEALNGQEVRH